MENPRLLFVHAHPDDETLTTGATIAHYVAKGAEVQVVTGTPARHRQRFIDPDPAESVGSLVAIIRELRPHVVVTYDPNGGYGHPDHIHAHEVTTAAVAAAAGPDHPGDRWQVPKFYWAVTARSAFDRGAREWGEAGLPSEWILGSADELKFTIDDADIDAVVDAPESRAAKVAALRA